MARRTVVAPEQSALQVKLMELLKGSTAATPVTTEHLATKTIEEVETILPELDALEDVHGLIKGERQSGTVVWWIESSTPKAAPVKRVAARKVAQPKAAKAPVTEPESQTGLTRAQVSESLRTVALEPVTTPAAPVAEIVAKVKAAEPSILLTNGAEQMKETPKVLDGIGSLGEDWKNAEHESTIPDFKEPKSIPAPPEGVSPNFWELAFYAPTEPGRKFWRGKVDAQLAAWDAEQTAKRVAADDAPPF